MLPEEAFRILGLAPASSSMQDVTAAHRELSRQHHPDTAHGTTEAQSRLNEARSVAIAFIKQNRALVRLQIPSIIENLEKKISSENQKRADQIEQKIVSELAAREAVSVLHSSQRRVLRPI